MKTFFAMSNWIFLLVGVDVDVDDGANANVFVILDIPRHIAKVV